MGCAQNGIFEDQTSMVPVILFPNASSTLSKSADALLFMTLLNSNSTKYLIREQLKATKYIFENNIETISTAYLIFEPGMKVGEVGNADLIKSTDIETSMAYSRLAKFFDFKILYLKLVADQINQYQKNNFIIEKRIQRLIFVGGGIKTPEQAKKACLAGADWIVTGNLTESFDDYNQLKLKLKTLIDEIKK